MAKKRRAVDRKMLSVDAPLHKALKAYADKSGSKIETLTNRAIHNFLTELGVKAPAAKTEAVV